MEYKLLRTKCTQPKTVRLETWNKSLVSHLRPRGEPGSCFSPGEVINLNLGVSTFENARWNMEEQRTSTQSWERSQRLYRIHCEGSVMYVRMSLMCQFNSGCVHNTILIPPSSLAGSRSCLILNALAESDLPCVFSNVNEAKVSEKYMTSSIQWADALHKIDNYIIQHNTNGKMWFQNKLYFLWLNEHKLITYQPKLANHHIISTASIYPTLGCLLW